MTEVSQADKCSAVQESVDPFFYPVPKETVLVHKPFSTAAPKADTQLPPSSSSWGFAAKSLPGVVPPQDGATYTKTMTSSGVDVTMLVKACTFAERTRTSLVLGQGLGPASSFSRIAWDAAVNGIHDTCTFRYI
jgi:hypothetical protein